MIDSGRRYRDRPLLSVRETGKLNILSLLTGAMNYDPESHTFLLENKNLKKKKGKKDRYVFVDPKATTTVSGSAVSFLLNQVGWNGTCKCRICP